MAVNAQPLFPWPTTPTARTAATARLKAAIKGRAAEFDEAACALGEMAAARVECEAPGAPQAVKDEAVIRFSGYLAQADFGSIESENIGPKTVTFPTNHAGAFRLYGAYGLLAPWKVRRAGVIR